MKRNIASVGGRSASTGGNALLLPVASPQQSLDDDFGELVYDIDKNASVLDSIDGDGGGGCFHFFNNIWLVDNESRKRDGDSCLCVPWFGDNVPKETSCLSNSSKSMVKNGKSEKPFFPLSSSTNFEGVPSIEGDDDILLTIILGCPMAYPKNC